MNLANRYFGWARRTRASLLMLAAATLAVQASAQTASPDQSFLNFTAAPVGVSSASAQTLYANFAVSGYIGTFTPTATLHYGTSYSLGTLTCTGGLPETCTVPITFQPLLPGARHDAIFLMNGNTRIATLLINGIGQAPFAMMQPGVVTNPILSGPTYYYNATVDENGTAYVIAEISNTIYSITKAGVVTALAISGLNSPRALGIDGAGVLYIADQKYNSTTTTWDTVRNIQGSVPYPIPNYIQAITTGNKGTLYSTDAANIYAQSETGGSVTTTPINPAITQAYQLTVDSNENLFIGGYAVNLLTPGGTQTQVNTFGPTGMGVDAADTLYLGRFTSGSTSEGIGMVPASNTWSAPIGAGLDGGAPILGLGVAPDGTVWAGDYTNVDKVDRSQGALTLNAVNPNQVATPQTAYVYNGGNQPLTLISFGVTGDPGYTLTSPTTSPCTTGLVIAVGAICGVTVNYTAPTHAGSFTGTLSFVTNSLNTTATTQNVALVDNVTGAYVTAVPASLAFGNQAVNTTSASQSVVLTNNGYAQAASAYSTGASIGGFVTNAYTLTLGTGCNSIAVGGSCTVTVTFKPPTAIAYNATGSVYMASGANVNIPLSGTGVASVPTVSLSPSPLTFSSQPEGTPSAPQAVTLANTGAATLTISAIAITSTNSSSFSQTNNCGTSLSAGSSCTINVTFFPGATGSLSASLTVTDNAADSPESVPLSGSATGPPTVPQLQFFPATVNLFAGAGPGCSSTGDGGPALSATLCEAVSAAVDNAGNTYIVDQQYNTVRKVDIHGNISPFAGIPRNAGFNFSSGDNGPATSAYLDVPTDVAVDPSGNVYIVESYASKIREVNATTGIITTFVGGASGNFHGGTGANVALGEPIGITFDPAGNLYIGTFGQYLVIKVTPAGVATAFAGTGTQGYNGDNIQATAAELTYPSYVASDTAGNIYIEDGSPNSPGTGNCRFRKVATTGVITTVAGTGTCGLSGDGGLATSAQINTSYGPFSIDLAGDLLFNTATSTGPGSTVRKVGINGIINTIVGAGTGQPPTTPFPATGPYFPGILAARLDNSGDLLMPINTGISSNYADQVFNAGPGGFLQFASQPVNSTSSPLTITLEDTGSAPLTLSQTTYTATGDFAVTGGTCIGLSSLTSGSTCTLTVTFAPTTTGSRTGSITVGSNASGGSQSITLQGTGAAPNGPAASLTPAALSFPDTAAGSTSSALVATLSNTGTAALTISGITLTGTNPSAFVQSSNCGSSLAASSSCTISITFKPTASGPYSATLSVADNVGSSPQTVTLSGNGTAPQVNLAPTSVAFGNQLINTASASQTVTLTNGGTAPLSISTISLTGTNAAEFATTSGCGASLGAGLSCNISVTFTPTATGLQTATLTVTDNASGSPQTVALTGSGIAPGATLSPSSVAFGNQVINTTSSAQTVTLSSSGGATLAISGISITGANPAAFTMSTTCGSTLSAASTCTITVNFAPTTAGSQTATLTVADNATGSPQTVALTGTGAAPQATLTPATITFPSQIINTTSATQTVTLANPGTAPLTISGIAVGGANPGSFSETTTCGATLAASASCTFTLAFTPSAVTSYGATLTVTDNASGGTQTSALAGAGLPVAAPIASLSPSTLTFGSTVVGGSAATQSLTLSNTGNAALPITSIAIGGANASSFTQVNTCGASLAAGASCPITITFTPSAAGSLNATVSVTDAATGSPQTAALAGTAYVSSDFTLAVSPGAATVTGGNNATFTVTVGAANGTVTGAVTLVSSNLPGATITFSPPSLSPGSSTATSTMTVQTTAALAELKRPNRGPLGGILFAFAIPLFAGRRKLRGRMQRIAATLSLVLLLGVGAATLSGCGGGFTLPSHTYAITVTAASSTNTHTATVNLTVQ